MRYPGLDLLRGIAAFGIVGCHLGLLPATAVGMLLLHFTDTNVAIFGTVSGFLMAASVEKKGVEITSFVKARCRRLLPAYFFWTAVFIVMTITFDLLCDGGKVNPKFYTLHYWRSAIFFGTSSTHLWYVAWLFYWGIALRILWRWTRHWYVALPIAIFCLWRAAYREGDFNYYAMRLLAFMSLGIALHGLRDLLRRIPSFVWLCAAAAAVTAHATLASWNSKFLFDAAIVVPILALCTGERFCETAVGTWLGSVSFGVYLVHPLFAVGCAFAVRRLFAAPFSAPLLLADWLVVILLSLAFVLALRTLSRRMGWLRAIF